MMKRLLVIVLATMILAMPAMAELFSGPLEMEAYEKGAGKPGVDHSVYRVVVGNQLLEAPSHPVGYGSYVLIDGPSTEEGTVWYLEPQYKVGSKVKKNVLVTELSIKTKQILGNTHPYLEVSDEDIFILKVKYKDRKNPTVECYHNGDLVFNGFIRDLGERLINWYIYKEIWQTIGCGVWNHTIGLAGPVGSLTWCINAPWKLLEVEEEDGEIGLKIASPQGWRGWAEFPLEPQRLVTFQWGITYKVKVHKQWRVVHNTGIIDFDADGDTIPNWHEIEHGTNPFDPNDPGNPPQPVNVPDLRNKTVPEAQVVVDPLDLNLHPITYSYSDTVVKDHIISQSPPPNAQVGRGSDIAIEVSLGPRLEDTVLVPCYQIGDPYNAYDSELRDLLENAGFQVVRHIIYCPGNPDCGDVEGWHNADCWQTYKWSWHCGDRLPAGSTVEYWARGCLDCFEVGCDAEVVIDSLRAAGFTVVITEQHSSTIATGGLISYSPNCEEEPEDCTAHVCVSTGPNQVDPLVVAITSPSNNSTWRVGQEISFTSSVSGGVPPYTYYWHFPDSTFYDTASVLKIFYLSSQGTWPVYLDVTDHDGTKVTKSVFVGIAP